MRGLTVSEPMCLHCLLAAFVLFGMMKGNDPHVGDLFNFPHTWTIYAYPSPLHFKKTFIIVLTGGILFWIAERTEPFCHCSSCRSRGGSVVSGCISSFGWKWDGQHSPLHLWFLRWCQRPPGESFLYTHQPGTLSCLNSHFRKGKGGESPRKSIDPIHA